MNLAPAFGAATCLFAYGTLMVPQIVRALIGRVPPSSTAILEGYARYFVRGTSYPGIVPVATPDSNSKVDGTLYDGLVPSEWQLLDAYEGELYERRIVHVQTLAGKAEASSYVVRPGRAAELASERWELEWYLQNHGTTLPEN